MGKKNKPQQRTSKTNTSAKFKCMRCENIYHDFPGPTKCPNCGNSYVEWINYEDLKERGII